MNICGRDKLIKDNVHEYIYINENYFSIIDTAIFQRLKNVKQTSYISLYPSSTHDRFIHSLGTYYLGKRVISEMWKNIEGKLKLPFEVSTREKITFTFEIACLLHDLGHAPFSHTGEDFYKVKKMDETLSNYQLFQKYKEENKLDKFCYLDGLLINELAAFNSEDEKPILESAAMQCFLDDYRVILKQDSTKPHEKMSALIALREMKKQILDLSCKICRIEKDEDGHKGFDADLFVRCITGVRYMSKPSDNEKSKELTFKNVIISLLNSDIIDVDKLDYILRDNYMTGYKNVGIDTERLIKSFTVVLEDDRWCRLAYKKNALSVIENVILANDSSRRWVQNHPIILYDTYITQRCISETFQILQELEESKESIFEKFFSVEALTERGIEWLSHEKIFLASDLDVITMFKRAYEISRQKGMEDAEQIFKEYFSRNARRHPLWKSEMEFSVCFNKKEMNLDEEERMKKIEDAVMAIDACQNMKTGVRESIITESVYKKMRSGEIYLTKIGIKFIEALKVFFNQQKKELDVAIICTESFVSKLKKLNKKAVYVEMPDYALERWKHSNIYSYSELVDIQNNSNYKTVFYLYSKHKVNTKDLVTYLLTEADLS